MILIFNSIYIIEQTNKMIIIELHGPDWAAGKQTMLYDISFMQGVCIEAIAINSVTAHVTVYGLHGKLCNKSNRLNLISIIINGQ